MFAAPSFADDDDAVGGVIGQDKDRGEDKGKGKNGNGNGGGDNPGKGNGRDKVPVTPQAPVTPQRPDPPKVERPDPPKQQRPDPPKAQRPDPPKAERPDPPKPQRPDPPKAERPDPPKVERPDPPKVERPDPPKQQRPDRPKAERPDPPEPTRPDPRPSRPDQPRQTPRPSSPRPVQSPSGSDDRVEVDGIAPVTGGNTPVGTSPGAALPAPGTSGPLTPSLGGGEAPRLGSLVDSADRSRRGGSSRRPVTRSTGGGGTRVAGTPVVRQDARGGVTYEVAGPGSRSTREVRVLGGVFGAMPAAGIQATQEVAGATEEGRTLGRASSDSDEKTGVVRVLSQPFAAFDEATGGRVSPLLLMAALAAVFVAFAVGIRRGLHRW